MINGGVFKKYSAPIGFKIGLNTTPITLIFYIGTINIVKIHK